MPKKLLFYFLGLMLAGMASATWALAQPAEAFRGGGGFQERFQQVKRTQMGPALGVNQQTVDQLLQIDQRYQAGRRQLIQDMKIDYQRLQQAMSQPAPSQQEVVRAILRDMKRKRQEMQELQFRQGEEEDALLTPVQQARYLMYNQSLMREARTVKRGPGETAPFTPGGPREVPVINPSGR